MASSKLKRVTPATEAALAALAEREGRTFVAQLDRVVDAGMAALGEPPINRDPTPAKVTPQPAKVAAKASSKATTAERQPATAGK